MKSVDSVDKIDVEELMKEFKITDINEFRVYLKELWKDLSLRSSDMGIGINLVTFNQYFDLPGIILDRLFNVFDRNGNGVLDESEFSDGMFLLFTQNFDCLAQFIFKFYDFDGDGYITKEDVRTILSYVTLKVPETYFGKMRFENANFKDRMDSQNELVLMLNETFEDLTKADFKTFMFIIENKRSEIFLYLIIFLLNKRPFSKTTLQSYSSFKINNNAIKSPIDQKRLIVSPKLESKFSPTLSMAKSPTIGKRSWASVSMGGSSVLCKLTGKEDQKNKLLNYALAKKGSGDNKEDFNRKNNPIRKKMHNLTNLEEDLKNSKMTKLPQIFTRSPEIGLAKKYENREIEAPKQSNDENKDEILNEGYLYKITVTKKLKKLWFKQVDKDLYYYREKGDITHKGMHNLSGVFLIQEPDKVEIDDTQYLSFSVIYPKKTRVYYCDNEKEYENWVSLIRKAIGYSNLSDLYEVKQKLGNGKFGLVKLGIHKESGRKVAIKIINKSNMSLEDQGLVKSEIEILKICQHPNIIKLYDVFENVDNIYIIMEYCAGGDLFSYLEKRAFKLSEPHTCEIVHKLSMAVCYLHSYGIIHRDLKPENILMTDDSDSADIRLLDFGLSKIVGPGECCSEPYGTLFKSYVAPEVLLERPYLKAVDLWTIGIITYLLLCGCLPFDDEHSEKEIARQTIHDPTPFPGYFWKKLSLDAKNFVENLLSKDPSNRMSIKEVLEHRWMARNIKSKIFDQRRKSLDMTSDLKSFVSSS